MLTTGGTLAIVGVEVLGDRLRVCFSTIHWCFCEERRDEAIFGWCRQKCPHTASRGECRGAVRLRWMPRVWGCPPIPLILSHEWGTKGVENQS